MGDTKAFERRGRSGQNRIDADAQLVRTFLRFAAEIDRDHAEFRTLRRAGTNEPDFTAVGGYHRDGRGIATPGSTLDPFCTTRLGYCPAGAPAAAAGGLARAG